VIEETVAGPELVRDASLLDRGTAGQTYKQGQRVIGIGEVAARSRIGRRRGGDP
jgi:hypothetical protein